MQYVKRVYVYLFCEYCIMTLCIKRFHGDKRHKQFAIILNENE